MSSAEKLLSSPFWRIRHSAWMLWGLLSFSMLAFVGWGYIGIKSKNKAWMATAAGFLAWTIGYVIAASIFLPTAEEAASEPESTASLAAGFSILLVWAIGSAAAWWVNRRWLVWLAKQGKPASWYAAAAKRDQVLPNPPATTTPASVIDAALLASPAAPSPTPPSAPVTPPQPDPIDLNAATTEQLTTLPGIDQASAAQIVAARTRVGGFVDSSDVVTVAGLQPHLFARIREQVTVLSPPRASSPRAPEESPSDGRRLEF